MSAAGSLLSVTELHAHYGKSHILHGVTFDVAQREVVSLLGRNGSGRSTTLKTIMGLVRPSRGQVRVRARELAGARPYAICRAGVAYVPEERGIFSSLSVEENLMLRLSEQSDRDQVYERFRVLPVLIYDTEDGNVRCTSCNICAKVCPPQCIWMTQAKGPKGNVVPLPEEFFIDMDVCMNCGLCSEYCPFDAIKMDQNFELSNYERHQTHIFSMQDLLVSSEFYARTHPDAWASAERSRMSPCTTRISS